MLESLAGLGNYNEADFCLRLDELLVTLDGSPEGGRYTDTAMRDVWHARQVGRNWSQADSFADTAEAFIRTPVLAARFYSDFNKLLEHLGSNVRLTHRGVFVLSYGGFLDYGDKLVAVPFRAIGFTDQSITYDITRRELENLPKVR